MFKFFRRIREDLISKKRIGNYLLYAIGEIILVMIGILLAVEINNLNKQAIKEQTEVDILNEMISDLNEDAEDILENIAFHRAAENSSLIIRNVLINDLPFHDSLKAHFSSSYNFTAVAHLKGAYKILETQGISLIQNDSLRFLITNYYDARVPYQIKIEEGAFRHAVIDAKNALKLFKNFTYIGDLEPWDFEAMKQDREYISWLSFTAFSRGFEAGAFELLLEDNLALVEMIKKELASRKADL